MKAPAFTLFLFVLSVNALNAQSKEFGWLEGTWKLKDKDVYEVWKLADDGKTLEGISYRIRSNDTIVTERIRLVYKNGSFHYVPDVAGDQAPVDFTITSHTSDSFVAENPTHDFPKLIRYQRIRKDQHEFIEAAIEGNGKVIAYLFSRLK